MGGIWYICMVIHLSDTSHIHSTNCKLSIVSSIFIQSCLQAPTGTLEEKRTTVPLVYSMDPAVRLLSVIDFPGVDDCDQFIQKLCRWMLEMVQVAVFVVDYR